MFEYDHLLHQILHELQGMSCEGACVRAKSILESVRDVHACSPFLCHRTFDHFLGQNCQKMLIFVLKTILELEWL